MVRSIRAAAATFQRLSTSHECVFVFLRLYCLISYVGSDSASTRRGPPEGRLQLSDSPPAHTSTPRASGRAPPPTSRPSYSWSGASVSGNESVNTGTRPHPCRLSAAPPSAGSVSLSNVVAAAMLQPRYLLLLLLLAVSSGTSREPGEPLNVALLFVGFIKVENALSL